MSGLLKSFVAEENSVSAKYMAGAGCQQLAAMIQQHRPQTAIQIFLVNRVQTSESIHSTKVNGSRGIMKWNDAVSIKK